MFRHLFHTHSDRFPFFFNAAAGVRRWPPSPGSGAGISRSDSTNRIIKVDEKFLLDKSNLKKARPRDVWAGANPMKRELRHSKNKKCTVNICGFQKNGIFALAITGMVR
ncbi:MAG: hypothetical protein ACLVK4_06850 [Alistipes shahii]|uniref:hypothetical protein n=1 Tax=Alistipes shahii TaxID=328814 RepID=UPI00399C58DC